jgi:RNA polymerase sigma-70 factor, ECF subfamily
MGVMPISEFEGVYRTHFDAVWRTLRRLGVPEKDATDAAQEVFLIAYRRLAEFEGRSSMKTWLFGIAFRVASNRRNRGSQRREVMDDGLVEALGVTSNFETEMEQRDLLRLLERVLDRLPLEQRAVFTLYEMEGLTGDEIAAALGVPAGTVRSRLRLAREAFSSQARALRRELVPQALAGGAG